MHPINKWWILCAVLSSSVVRPGSCRTGRHADGYRPEQFIFNEVCAHKQDSGPCKARFERFFFNVETGKCGQFVYGGCAGNDNNFDTLEKCEETCVVTADKNPCHLPEAPGPCRALLRRYYFDTKSHHCKQFYYGGCHGNPNNFRTLGQCHARCPNRVKPPKESEVLIQLDIDSSIAQPTVLTGELTVQKVQTNKSNSEAKEGKTMDLCSSPVERGPCDGAVKRFAYNPKVKKCQLFPYSGCGGNANNFMTRRDCAIKCGIRNGSRRMIRVRKKILHGIVNRSA